MAGLVHRAIAKGGAPVAKKRQTDISARILREIARKDYRPQRAGGLARMLGVGDDEYAAFGKVIEGMDIVRSIATVDTTTKYGMQNWPVDDITINSITIENQ